MVDVLIIDSELLDKCTERADIVKGNKQIRELLGLDLKQDPKVCAVYNEYKLEDHNENGYGSWGYKGIIDNFVIDVPTKSVRVNDFKSSSSTTSFEPGNNITFPTLYTDGLFKIISILFL